MSYDPADFPTPEEDEAMDEREPLLRCPDCRILLAHGWTVCPQCGLDADDPHDRLSREQERRAEDIQERAL